MCKNTSLQIFSSPVCKIPMNTQTTFRSYLIVWTLHATNFLETLEKSNGFEKGELTKYKTETSQLNIT